MSLEHIEAREGQCGGWRDISEYDPKKHPLEVLTIDASGDWRVAQYQWARSSRSPAWWASVPGRWAIKPTHFFILSTPSSEEPSNQSEPKASAGTLAQDELIPTPTEGKRSTADRVIEAARDVVEFCDDPHGSESSESLAQGLARLMPALRSALSALEKEGKASERPIVEPIAYDAGLLSDYGGGNVEWWQDYIRAELDRAHNFYAEQLAALTSPPAEGAK